jgi:hypothetical protein
MILRAVILVPSQGNHVEQFYWSARELKRAVYESRARIVKAEVGAAPSPFSEMIGEDSRPVRFHTEKKKPFAFAEVRNLRSVLTISHAGTNDGPNLLYGAGGYQPWQSYSRDKSVYSAGGKFKVDMLRPKARAFWAEVGRAMAPEGRIIMLGCNLGTSAYIHHVANASARRTYGPTASFSAADVETVVTVVRQIEKGSIIPPMREAKPGDSF